MKKPWTKNFYDRFVREGRNAGFIDDQVDFIWDWMWQLVKNPETFTHKDNYVEEEQKKPEECCDKCKNSKFALKGKLKEKAGSGCGLSCECHRWACEQCDFKDGKHETMCPLYTKETYKNDENVSSLDQKPSKETTE